VPFERAMGEIDLAGRTVAVVDDNGLTPSHPEVRAALRSTADALIVAAGLREVEVTVTCPDPLPGAAAMLLADGDPDMAELMPEIMANLFVTPGAGPLMEVGFANAELTLEAMALHVQMRHTLDQELAAAFAR